MDEIPCCVCSKLATPLYATLDCWSCPEADADTDTLFRVVQYHESQGEHCGHDSRESFRQMVNRCLASGVLESIAKSPK